MVHLEIDFEDLPTTYQLLEIDLPNDVGREAISVVDIEKVSPDWRLDPTITRGLLTSWFEERRTAVVSVPSAIVPFGTNFLINPLHAEASRLSVVHAARYPYDQRLFGAPGGRAE
jgi:RES domain-containing protein